MEHKYEDLHAELIKHLREFFIDDPCPLLDKKFFITNPLLDHLIFEIFVHQLWGKPTYEESIAEFLKAEKEEQDAFDGRLRDKLYDILYMARVDNRQTV